jgi:hypothetical protein
VVQFSEGKSAVHEVVHGAANINMANQSSPKKLKILIHPCYTKARLCFVALLFIGLCQTFGDQLLDGAIFYNPPFPMRRGDLGGGGLPRAGIMYRTDPGDGTNIYTQVDFMFTSVLWFSPRPDQATSISSVEDLKALLEAESAGKFVKTNYPVKIVKLDGLDAVEYGGEKEIDGMREKSLWTYKVCIFWHKEPQWQRSTILLIDVAAQREEVCKRLVESVKAAKIRPPPN